MNKSCRIVFNHEKGDDLDPITASLIMLTAFGGAIGSHYFNDNENKKHLLQAKKNAYEIERKINIAVNADIDWKDKKGIDLFIGDDNSQFYPAVIVENKEKKILHHLKMNGSQNEEVTVNIKPVTEDFMYAAISSTVEKQNFNLLVAYEKIKLSDQIPVLYADAGFTNNIKYSSFAYDNLYKTLGCLTKPNLLIAYAGCFEEQEVSFRVPDEPCGKNIQKIDVAYEHNALLYNVNYIDTAYFQEKTTIANSNISEVILAGEDIDIDKNSYIDTISTDTNYSFPRIMDTRENNNSKYNYLEGYQFTKECNFGEILHIGNGFLRTLKINRGCSAVVLEGDNYKIGNIIVELGAKSEIKFSKDTVVEVNALSLSPQSDIYLTAVKSKDAHLRINAEKINLGKSENSFMGSVVEQESGEVTLNCVHPGTCLYDTNDFFIASGSTVIGDIVVHKTLNVDSSQIIGTTYANAVKGYNSSFSNIVRDDNKKVISKYYIEFFKKMANNTARTFLKPHKVIECKNKKECEKLAER